MVLSPDDVRRKLESEGKIVKLVKEPEKTEVFRENATPELDDLRSDYKKTDLDIQLDDLLNRLDIVTVYKTFIKKMTPHVGNRTESIMISCPKPDHADKTPSAWINSQKGQWYCGACEEGGDKYDIAAYGLNYPVPAYKTTRASELFPKLRREMASYFGYTVVRGLGRKSEFLVPDGGTNLASDAEIGQDTGIDGDPNNVRDTPEGLSSRLNRGESNGAASPSLPTTLPGTRDNKAAGNPLGQRNLQVSSGHEQDQIHINGVDKSPGEPQASRTGDLAKEVPKPPRLKTSFRQLVERFESGVKDERTRTPERESTTHNTTGHGSELLSEHPTPSGHILKHRTSDLSTLDRTDDGSNLPGSSVDGEQERRQGLELQTERMGNSQSTGPSEITQGGLLLDGISFGDETRGILPGGRIETVSYRGNEFSTTGGMPKEPGNQELHESTRDNGESTGGGNLRNGLGGEEDPSGELPLKHVPRVLLGKGTSILSGNQVDSTRDGGLSGKGTLDDNSQAVGDSSDRKGNPDSFSETENQGRSNKNDVPKPSSLRGSPEGSEGQSDTLGTVTPIKTDKALEEDGTSSEADELLNPDRYFKYPSIDWKNLVPENTFLHQYLQCCAPDEVPEEYHFWCGLMAVGQALGRNTVLFDRKPVYGNLFICTVGPSGSGKSSAATAVSELLQKALPWEPGDPFTTGTKFIATPGSAEVMIKSFSRLLALDPSAPKLIENLPVKGLVEFSELSALVGKISRIGSTLQSTLIDFYDMRNWISTSALSSGEHIARDAFCSVLTTTQLKSIKVLLNQQDASGGFLNRWIFAMGPLKIRTPIGGAIIDVSPAVSALKGLRAWASSLPVVRWSKEALDLFTSFWYRDIVRVKESDYNDMLTRFDLLCKKLILLFSANRQEKVVSVETVKDVIALFPYLMHSYQIIDERVGVSEELETGLNIQACITHLTDKYKRAPSMREIGLWLKGKKYTNEQIVKQVQWLVEAGSVEEIAPVKGAMGRPTVRYRNVN